MKLAGLVSHLHADFIPVWGVMCMVLCCVQEGECLGEEQLVLLADLLVGSDLKGRLEVRENRIEPACAWHSLHCLCAEWLQ